MKTLILLLLFSHVASAERHSIKFYVMTSSGIPNSKFVAFANFKEVTVVYYDSTSKTSEPQQDWARRLMQDDPQYWEKNVQALIMYQQIFTAKTNSFKQGSQQTGGVHINQQILGCEWDDETDKVDGLNQYGYNGKDFLTFDLETQTWISATLQAEITQRVWNKNTAYNSRWKDFLTNLCPDWPKKYLSYGRSSLLRTELPSVSLLQKSPSSPVGCHATGFYPDRAMMFWRKDGEELHEDVDHGESLPNQDGTFQMWVDLNVSSVTPEDWRRYDCVFQLSGVEDEIITRLDKAVIRTNWEKPSNMTIPIIAAVIVLAIVFIAATGFMVYRRKKAPDNIAELAARLNPET